MTGPPELPLSDDLSGQGNDIVPGSLPLTNRRRERYCRLRVLGVSALSAARDAGFTAGLSSPAAERDRTAGLRGIVSKLERHQAIRARIAYLAGNTDEVLQAKRRRIEERLNSILDGSIRDYTRITDGGGLVLDASPIGEMPRDEQRELLAVVKSVSPSKFGTRVEMYSPLDAASQLRALNGLDAPKQVELGGIKGGEPIRSEIDLSRLSREQLLALREIVASAASADAGGDRSGTDAA